MRAYAESRISSYKEGNICEVNTHVYLQLLEKLFQSIVSSKKVRENVQIPS